MGDVGTVTRLVLVRAVLPCAVLLAGCGDGSQAPAQDAASWPSNCDYVEVADLTNNGATSDEWEVTGRTVTTTPLRICGAIDPGHFTGQWLDRDIFRLELPEQYPAGAEVLVRLSSPEVLAVSGLSFSVYGPDFDSLGGARVQHDHAATLAKVVAPGVLSIAVEAYNPADVTAPLPYMLSVEVASPTDCPFRPGTGYLEAGDGATSDGNDVMNIRLDEFETYQTTTAADAPELVSETVTETTKLYVQGISADVSPHVYVADRDTYQFTTGPQTNEVRLRLSWPHGEAELSYFLFERDAVVPEFYVQRRGSPILSATAVKPVTDYWLVVFGHAFQDNSGLPINYDVSICGDRAEL
jgi:hypothetical protein